jgi:hypothetical protein
VAVGAVAVAAVTVFMGGIGGAGSSSGRRWSGQDVNLVL